MAIKEVSINPNKVAIYCRWSTDEQSYGTTCEIQLTGCKNYILSQGWNVNENLIFIDDGWSGGTLDRPHMKILRELIQEREIECVVVHKLDRLSRSLQDAVNLVVDEWEDIAYLKSVTEPISTDTMLGRQIFYLLMSLQNLKGKILNLELGVEK
jgi:site-specific DNA recombinase